MVEMNAVFNRGHSLHVPEHAQEKAHSNFVKRSMSSSGKYIIC